MTGDAFRDAIAANTTTPEVRALADKLADARVELEAADDITKRIRSKYEQLEGELFDALENAGITQIRTARGLFSLNDLAWASVTDEEQARQWAEHSYPELLTLNRQRLSKIVRDTLKGEPPEGMEAGELPPGVTYTTSRKINWRRS
jgi:hypothetical protein